MLHPVEYYQGDPVKIEYLSSILIDPELFPAVMASDNASTALLSVVIAGYGSCPLARIFFGYSSCANFRHDLQVAAWLPPDPDLYRIGYRADLPLGVFF